MIRSHTTGNIKYVMQPVIPIHKCSISNLNYIYFINMEHIISKRYIKVYLTAAEYYFCETRNAWISYYLKIASRKCSVVLCSIRWPIKEIYLYQDTMSSAEKKRSTLVFLPAERRRNKFLIDLKKKATFTKRSSIELSDQIDYCYFLSISNSEIKTDLIRDWPISEIHKFKTANKLLNRFCKLFVGVHSGYSIKLL